MPCEAVLNSVQWVRTGRRREMAIFRTVAFAIAVAALLPPALPAHACDSNYPWLCKPVPSIEPSETTETSKAVKPLPITTQRNEARAPKPAKARVQRSAQARVAQARVKHVARKPPARRLVLRPRHHNVAAALPEDLGPTPNEPTRIAPPKPSERAQKPAVPSAVA